MQREEKARLTGVGENDALEAGSMKIRWVVGQTKERRYDPVEPATIEIFSPLILYKVISHIYI